MFKIVGTYKGVSEIVDTAETREEARYLAAEYRMAFGNDWAIGIKGL